MYPWGYNNNVQQFTPPVSSMLFQPPIQHPNNIMISFNTAPTVPNVQSRIYLTTTIPLYKYTTKQQSYVSSSNNDDFMKQLAREVCKQLSNKDK